MDYIISDCTKESLARVITALEHSRKVLFRSIPTSAFKKYEAYSGLPEGTFLIMEIGQYEMTIETNRQREKASPLVNKLCQIAGGKLRIKEPVSSIDDFLGLALGYSIEPARRDID